MTPEEVVFIICVGVVAITTWIWIGVKHAPRAKPPELEAIEKRLARLEVAIDDMTAELSRVTEGQQFTNRLLGERSIEASRAS
jgi:hypothetical protein